MKTALDPQHWFAVRDGDPYRALGFAAIATARVQIEANHCDSLEAINAGGGLDWYELWSGMAGHPLFPAQAMSDGACRAFVLRAVSDHAFSQGRSDDQASAAGRRCGHLDRAIGNGQADLPRLREAVRLTRKPHLPNLPRKPQATSGR